MKRFSLVLISLSFVLIIHAQVWQPDLSNGNYKNPIIYADYSDPDVIRVNDDYYMVASSFTCMPGIPILHSKDLIGWKIIGHVYNRLPLEKYNKPVHGEGTWAPSIRFHNGLFYIYVCSPYDGLWCATAKNPAGPWTIELIEKVEYWEDPCPYWDEQGNAFLVHSKLCGGILYLHRMSADGKKLLDNGTIIFQDKSQPTIEGPKFMKKHDYYYILAAAGGVATGWQTVLRSKNIYGPYEYKNVLQQGNTNINGPHQGALVETQTGESWFIHFQDKGYSGRVVLLQPVEWKNGWPMMGIDIDKDGIGEPVSEFRKPNVGKTYPAIAPQTSDEFDSTTLGLQWQWLANPSKEWYSLTNNSGNIRLNAVKNITQNGNLFRVPNLLLQKLPAPAFQATTKVTFTPEFENEKCGLVVMGNEWSFISLEKDKKNLQIKVSKGKSDFCEDGTTIVQTITAESNTCFFRVAIDSLGICKYSYSINGIDYTTIKKDFKATPGGWIGAKVGIFCINPNLMESKGHADFDWFKMD